MVDLTEGSSDFTSKKTNILYRQFKSKDKQIWRSIKNISALSILLVCCAVGRKKTGKIYLKV